MRICPKCRHRWEPPAESVPTSCPHCGIIFAKYAEYLQQRAAGIQPRRQTTRQASASMAEAWHERLFGRPDHIDVSTLAGQALGCIVLLLWGGYFIVSGWRSNAVGSSFLHGVNLAFHEFGHLLFRPFGEWLMFLGGSLFQCLVPLIIAAVFLFREQQRFAAAVALWWCGQNLLDVAPYIGDARALDLSLIGEYSEDMVEIRSLRHDWHNILDRIGLLAWDERLATLAHLLGSCIMLAALAWAAWIVWCGWQLLRELGGRD